MFNSQLGGHEMFDRSNWRCLKRIGPMCHPVGGNSTTEVYLVYCYFRQLLWLTSLQFPTRSAKSYLLTGIIDPKIPDPSLE